MQQCNSIRYSDSSGHCIGPLLTLCLIAAAYIADNAAIIASVAITGAILSFVGPSNPDPVLINDPVASQQALDNSALQAYGWLTLGQAALEFSSVVNSPAPKPGSTNSVDDISSDKITVGRWMSQEEYLKMQKTLKVQEGSGGTTYVLYPASPDSYAKQAAPGSVYAEFDVPASSVQITNSQLGWGRINGPNSSFASYYEMLGRPVPQFPSIQNLRFVSTKPQ